MHVRGTHQAIEHTLDAIMIKGGETLYGTYIKQKLPNHATEGMRDLITRNFNLPYADTPAAPTIPKDNKPRQGRLDPYTPQKVIHHRSKSQL